MVNSLLRKYSHGVNKQPISTVSTIAFLRDEASCSIDIYKLKQSLVPPFFKKKKKSHINVII